jgi:DNA polymerase/3'-5' exonuclease PolX
MGDKPKIPRAAAFKVAEEIMVRLMPCCERIAIAGSLRRGKAEVGDIEILYIPKMTDRADGLFDRRIVSVASEVIDGLLTSGYFSKRPSKTGVFSWGEANKLAIHTASGIPVDLFSVLPERCSCGMVLHESKDITTTKPDSIQTKLRCLPEVLRGEKREGVLQEVQQQSSMDRGDCSQARQELSDNEVPCVQKEICEQELLERKKGVFPGMHKNTSREGVAWSSGVEQKQGDASQGRLCDDLRPGEIRGTQKRTESVCDGTQAGDGKTPKEASGKEGTGSPQEWDKERQQAVELGNSFERDAHGESNLSPLLERVSDKIICPICHGTGWHCPNWWVALVIRTGSKDTNLALTTGANRKNATLMAYGAGVKWSDGTVTAATSEQHVFEMCGVPYKEPKDR